jgi:hypothetical protein
MMGLELSVRFPPGSVPAWPAVRDLLARKSCLVQLRMIDGELSFPDELPPASWRELRLGTSQGMITVRREADRLFFVVWGNAEPALLQARDLMMTAFAEAGNGKVES